MLYIGRDKELWHFPVWIGMRHFCNLLPPSIIYLYFFQPGLNPQSQVHFQTSLSARALMGLLGFSGPSITFRQSHAPPGLTFVLFSNVCHFLLIIFLVEEMVKSNGLAFKILCERYLSANINNSFIIIWENWDKIL